MLFSLEPVLSGERKGCIKVLGSILNFAPECKRLLVKHREKVMKGQDVHCELPVCLCLNTKIPSESQTRGANVISDTSTSTRTDSRPSSQSQLELGCPVCATGNVEFLFLSWPGPTLFMQMPLQPGNASETNASAQRVFYQSSPIT